MEVLSKRAVECLVFGYLRNLESSNASSCAIELPLDIKYIIAQYVVLECISIARGGYFEISKNLHIYWFVRLPLSK